ncbi:F-box only protein 5-like [Haliotis rubra]|uniref:F-box only protein 5-like n=1 Tax=Haliotis rubra TaxID=36100 RepID=UPI001EE5D843|nr:F-box only protein 5-like [Haliotis rubra]
MMASTGYQRSRKVSMPALHISKMDYSNDFSDVIKSRSISTSTPMASKILSPLSLYSPGNDSGYPDSLVEDTKTSTDLLNDTAFLETTPLVSTDCDLPEDNAYPLQFSKCDDMTCDTDCASSASLEHDWLIPEEEEVFEKRHKRLSDFPRYSLEFESGDLDSSFGASGLADKLDSVGIHDVIQHFSPKEPDRLIGRKVGLEKVDILNEMHARSIEGVSLVLSYLEPKELCRIRAVSRQWKTICDTDNRASARCHKYIKSLKSRAASVGKENLGKTKTGHRHLTPGGLLTSVQHTPRSPKKMPVVNLFTQHSQVVSSLKSDDTLRHCPRCNSAAKTHCDRGVCTSDNCKFDFCVKCFCEHHGSRELRASGTQEI